MQIAVALVVMLLVLMPCQSSAGLLDGLMKPDESQWQIVKDKDKLTDKMTIEATKIYTVDGGGEIDAKAMCLELGSSNGFSINGLSFVFDYFAKGDQGTGDEKESAYEISHNEDIIPVFSSGGNYNTAVASDSIPIQYRIDNQPVQTKTINPKYANQATLDFLTDVSELAKAKQLRVRLPLAGGLTGDIEIQLADLQTLFVDCPFATTAETYPKDWTAEDKARGYKYTNTNVATSMTSSNPMTYDYDTSATPIDTAKLGINQGANPDVDVKKLNPTVTSSVTPDETSGVSADTSTSSAVITLPVSNDTPSAASPTPDSAIAAPIPSPVSSPRLSSNHGVDPHKSAIDILVRSNPQLVAMDIQISRVYRQLRRTLDHDAADDLAFRQKQWLASRAQVCGLSFGNVSQDESARITYCLQGIYRGRLGMLQAQLR